MPKDRFPHDASYKSLFTSPALVRSLLQDFVAEDFVQDLDFDTLQQGLSEYTTDDLQERQNDVIWRLRFRGSWCYIYLMVEFQSSQHHWMALRMLSYTALLWETLVKNGSVKSNEQLPPVFPIVLYNGDSPWNATRDVADLIAPCFPTLEVYQPRYKYYIIDAKRISPDVLREAKGEAAYVMKVEQADRRARIIELAIDFDKRQWNDEQEHTRLAMLEWMDRKIKQLTPDDQSNVAQILAEDTMLAELIAKYKQPYIDEGFSKGYTLGETKGIIGSIQRNLIDKFGSVKNTWIDTISSINNPEQLYELSVAIGRVSTKDEVDAILREI